MAGDVALSLEATIAALREENRLTDVHTALVEACRGLARAVESDETNAALWREYRQSLTALVTLDRGTDDGSAARFLVSVRTPVGDAEK